MTKFTRSSLDNELAALQDDLLRLGSLLDIAIVQAMKALTTRDAGLAQSIINADAHTNALRYHIEEACYTLLATQQPAAGDLRAVIAAFSIASDLERMADHAAGIATIVIQMGDEPLLKPLIDLPHMADACRQMVRSALDAYTARDAEAAQAVATCDDAVDTLYQQVFRELLSFMLEDPQTTTRALRLLFVAHNLERIADRAVNIAERVVFMTSGKLEEFADGKLEEFN